jgi:hypothetical protein
MFGLVIDPGLATHPHPRKNPTLPHQGLVWQCRVTRRCRIRGWSGVASLLCPMIWGSGIPILLFNQQKPTGFDSNDGF